MKLTEAQREVLETLEFSHYRSSVPQKWCTPLDVGGYNGSHHSYTLTTLARKGLVQSKQRGDPNDPPDGENGKKIWRGRGSKCYRITEAGRAALEQSE